MSDGCGFVGADLELGEAGLQQAAVPQLGRHKVRPVAVRLADDSLNLQAADR